MVFFLSLVYADGILLDDTVSFSRASCVCMCKRGGGSYPFLCIIAFSKHWSYTILEDIYYTGQKTLLLIKESREAKPLV